MIYIKQYMTSFRKIHLQATTTYSNNSNDYIDYGDAIYISKAILRKLLRWMFDRRRDKCWSSVVDVTGVEGGKSQYHPRNPEGLAVVRGVQDEQARVRAHTHSHGAAIPPNLVHALNGAGVKTTQRDSNVEFCPAHLRAHIRECKYAEDGAADCALRSRLTERKTHDAATPLWEKCCFRCNVVVVCTVQRST
ncbi:hypothetical protein QTP88_023376 [Uroleucon formosanum]